MSGSAAAAAVLRQYDNVYWFREREQSMRARLYAIFYVFNTKRNFDFFFCSFYSSLICIAISGILALISMLEVFLVNC